MPSDSCCVFFDVDDTLYPPERGVWNQIGLRINRYLVERVGILESEAERLRQRYFLEYGTTCKGLQAEHRVDPEEYYRFVHDFPLDRYLSPDPSLKAMLAAVPAKKVIFSNADRPYIQRVLSALDVAEAFDGIIDIFATGFACKPMDAAYRIAAEKTGSPQAADCMLIDDQPRNLRTARGMGWKTVLVHSPDRDGSADHHFDSIHRVAELFR
ncbi:MAG: pyrimidine 5'-nucleotidase [Anaerolineales bacterium]|nr:pyrimidine 5'-nucleotidase [Anaerolineales bacterium]